MANVTKKTALRTVNGTPKKRFILSIIRDYDLRTGLCELVDNALDPWVHTKMKAALKVSVVLDPDRQFIQVSDNAGGVKEDEAELLVALAQATTKPVILASASLELAASERPSRWVS